MTTPVPTITERAVNYVTAFSHVTGPAIVAGGTAAAVNYGLTTARGLTAVSYVFKDAKKATNLTVRQAFAYTAVISAIFQGLEKAVLHYKPEFYKTRENMKKVALIAVSTVAVAAGTYVIPAAKYLTKVEAKDAAQLFASAVVAYFLAKQLWNGGNWAIAKAQTVFADCKARWNKKAVAKADVNAEVIVDDSANKATITRLNEANRALAYTIAVQANKIQQLEANRAFGSAAPAALDLVDAPSEGGVADLINKFEGAYVPPTVTKKPAPAAAAAAPVVADELAAGDELLPRSTSPAKVSESADEKSIVSASVPAPKTSGSGKKGKS